MYVEALTTPGQVISNPDQGQPEFVRNQSATVGEAEQGWSNFTVIETIADSIEFLHLDYNGHRRARISWKNNLPKPTWLVP